MLGILGFLTKTFVKKKKLCADTMTKKRKAAQLNSQSSLRFMGSRSAANTNRSHICSQPQPFQPILHQSKTNCTFSRLFKTHEKTAANPETKKRSEAQPAKNDRGL
jgi:hypothetical protein